MVELKVRLNILSKDELNDFSRDVTELEMTARRSSTAKAKVQRNTSKSRGLGIFGEGANQGQLPSAIIRKRKQSALDRKADAALGSAGNRIGKTSGLISGAGAPYARGNAFKDLQRQVSLNTKATQALQRGMSGFMQMGALSRGGAGGLLNMGMGFASKILPIAVATAIATQVFEIWKNSYGAGGVNDVRKLVLDDVSSFVGLERESAIMSGRQFFANSRTLRMGPEIQTNTENLRDGFYRTRLLRAQYGRA